MTSRPNPAAVMLAAAVLACTACGGKNDAPSGDPPAGYYQFGTGSGNGLAVPETTTAAPAQSTPDAAPQQGEAPAPPAATPTATTVGNGNYLVGSEMPPGTYRSPGPDGSWPTYGDHICWWTRWRDASHDPGSSLAIGTSNAGPGLVTIKPTDGTFESRGCQPWTKVQ
jgi:hypothetical protein